MFSRLFWIFSLATLIFTRVYGFDWGLPFSFHPDENNMALAVTRLSDSQLDPKFYAYGQFPLFLAYFTSRLTGVPSTFTSAALILRLYSALWSIIAGVILYHLVDLLLPRPGARLSLPFYTFHPGLIQLAHFGTTESLLILVFVANLYLSLRIIRRPTPFHLFLVAILSGIGLASKISALVFLFPVYLALVHTLVTSRHRLKIVFLGLWCLLITLTTYFVLSPQNYLNRSEFFDSMRYETGVATGAIKVFYTSQFLHTRAYLFQVIKIFPYVSGIPQFVLGLAGLIFLLFSFKRSRYRLGWFIVLSSCLVYFLYFGQLYTKWTRFMSPLFILFPILSALLAITIKNRALRISVFFLCLIPGLSFFQLYLRPDIRLTTSQWLNQNLPPQAKILSEGGNVVDIPVINEHDFKVTNFDFFTLEEREQSNSELQQLISTADYILVPSRRVYKNRSTPEFPLTSQYYQDLLTGKSGFVLIATFSPQLDLWLDNEDAEETWTVFDHPTIRLYQRT